MTLKLSLPELNKRQSLSGDAIVLRIIGTLQGLVSLGFLALTPFLFNYGGAAASPTAFQLWIAFWLSGVIIGICLFNVRLWTRLLALLWNGTALWQFVLRLREHTDGRHPNDAGRAWLILSVSVTAYLAVSGGVLFANAYREWQDRRMARRVT